MEMKQGFRLSLFAIASALLLGCQGFSLGNAPTVPTSSIQEIRQLQDRETTAVYLKGQVVRQAPFLRGGAYLLQDGTGQIWVVTEGSLPTTGDEIVIQGKPEYQAISVGGQDLGEVFVRELEQLWMSGE